MTAYTRFELYQMWRDGFCGQHDEVRVLMDFALCDRAEAKTLLRDFETRHAAELLNMEHRGKSE